MTEDWKIKGNSYFAKGDYQRAIDAYTQAIKCGSADDNPILYSNRAAAYMKVGQSDKVRR